jgi:hypothetical protein
MALNPAQYTTNTRRQRQEYALHQALASLSPEEQRSVWAEIEEALGQFETYPGFVGPCELVIAGAT